MQKLKLDGNTILITGGSSGIGLEMTKRLARENKVIICGRSLDKLEETKKEIRGIEIFQCDLSIDEERKKLITFITRKFPEMNILINNAAYSNLMNIITDSRYLVKAEDEMKTNFTAPVSLISGLLPHLKKKENSAIINITTGLVFLPKAVEPIYCASKAALHSFTKTLRLQLKDTGIKIIEVFPPAVDTPFHHGKAPKIAIPVEHAVNELISGLKKNKNEIHIAGAKLAYFLSRFFPKLGFKLINNT
jgi:uncharacterized oxidoreductase